MLLCCVVAKFSRVMMFAFVMASFVVLMPTKAFPVPDLLRTAAAGYNTFESRVRREGIGQQPNDFSIENGIINSLI